MILEQHYLECPSQASYLIGDESTGRAVVVDPRRDIAPYLESAAEHGMTIEMVIETHLHADFLSGHLELAAATGAEIAYESVANTDFESVALADGDLIPLGDVVLEIRHTPGHTALCDSGAVVLDTRDRGEFATGHLTGSVNVGLAGRYAEFVGGVIDPTHSIVLVGDPGTALETMTRLARIGFDNVVGSLDSPLVALEANPELVSRGSRLNVSSLEWVMSERDDLQLIDIRQPGETAGGVIEGALLIPLTRLNEQLDTLNADKPTVVYCAGGFRSSIGASRLKAAGFSDVSDLLGGYGAWTAARPEVGVS